MSYSFSANAVTADTFDADVAKGVDIYKASLGSNDYALDNEAAEQIDASVAAAKAIVQAGNVGAGPFNITFSGHANPGHKPRAGYANELATVSVASVEQAPAQS